MQLLLGHKHSAGHRTTSAAISKARVRIWHQTGRFRPNERPSAWAKPDI